MGSPLQRFFHDAFGWFMLSQTSRKDSGGGRDSIRNQRELPCSMQEDARSPNGNDDGRFLRIYLSNDAGFFFRYIFIRIWNVNLLAIAKTLNELFLYLHNA